MLRLFFSGKQSYPESRFEASPSRFALLHTGLTYGMMGVERGVENKLSTCDGNLLASLCEKVGFWAMLLGTQQTQLPLRPHRFGMPSPPDRSQLIFRPQWNLRFLYSHSLVGSAEVRAQQQQPTRSALRLRASGVRIPVARWQHREHAISFPFRSGE